jgi:hypothetical protein
MDTRQTIFFGLVRALLGEVFPVLRLVRFEFDDATVCVDYFVDGEVEEADAESVSCVEAELAADLDPEVTIVSRIHPLPASEAIPISANAVTVFRRRE